MYRLLETIKVTDLYELEKYKLKANDINIVMEFLDRKTMTVESLVGFLRYHNNYTWTMIKFIPTQILLNAYLDCNFLLNHMTQELHDYIMKKTTERFRIRLFLNQPYIQDLVQLNDYFNNTYNFSNPFILRKLDQLKKELDIIDWCNYYLGSNAIVKLANRKPIDIIHLYPKTKTIRFNSAVTYYKDDEGNYVCMYKNYVIIINKMYYSCLGEVLVEKEEIVCDNDNEIYCTLETYQKLGSWYDYEPSSAHSSHSVAHPLQDESQKVNQESLKHHLGFTGIFHKYKYPKRVVSHCYACKKYYDNELWYDRYTDMCLDCGKFNFDKRTKMANLTSCTAFVSGIRQKIGLQIALKLLRCGARVIGTTRFISATYYNYAKQPDFNIWKDRLIICKCDFLKLSSVMKLTKFLKTQSINIFINNACQTIRASPYYYEQLNLLENLIENVDVDDECLIQYGNNMNDGNNQLILHKDNNENELTIYKCTSNDQIIIIDNKIKMYDIKFNQFDDVKDKDIKDSSSWNQEISDICAGEILESVLINQTVPTLLISQLKAFMVKPRFIIQVTALEGQFETNKTSNHAHTNMCKSAMNMLIRTIYEEQDPDQYVYSINVGYISGVNPQHDHYP
ncbi:MAG: hypothetical protein MUO21_00080, partial [Nitrososphaeraceae archaeon]|nr:hypothetical protein [Nitrososphaeraceae archaeon]